MNELKKNTTFLSILRIIAAVAVVTVHTKSLTNDTTDGYMYLYTSIQWCVPIFFMITGYIFLGIKKYIDYSSVKKNIIKFLVTLFTIGWFFAFLERIFEVRSISADIFIYSLADVFTGNLWAHMWYVYAAIGLYLILPVLSAFVSKTKENLYILTVLCFIFNIVFYDISTICEIGFSFPLVDYCFYVLMGAVMYETEDTKLRKMFIPSILVLVILLVALAVRVYVYDITAIANRNSIFVAILTISVFIITNNIFISTKNTSFIKSASSCTWGIYLMHPIYINIFGKLFGINFAEYNQFAVFPVAVLLIYVISHITVLILKRMPLINKIL